MGELASVGRLHDGTPWFAPTNWVSHNAIGVVSTSWEYVIKVEPILVEGQPMKTWIVTFLVWENVEINEHYTSHSQTVKAEDARQAAVTAANDVIGKDFRVICIITIVEKTEE